MSLGDDTDWPTYDVLTRAEEIRAYAGRIAASRLGPGRWDSRTEDEVRAEADRWAAWIENGTPTT